MNTAFRPGLFRDRRHAGQWLAQSLHHLAHRDDVIVLALPRGGVPVAHEVALELHAPLDIFVVRKLGVPGHGEFAMGAVASGGLRVLNEGVIDRLHIPADAVEATAERELRELERRERLYRGHAVSPQVNGRVVVLVDDGLASTATLRVAVRALRRQGPARIVVGVPTASSDTVAAIRGEADEVVCATTPTPFHSVGAWYADFCPTSDAEVSALLAADAHRHAAATH